MEKRENGDVRLAKIPVVALSLVALVLMGIGLVTGLLGYIRAEYALAIVMISFVAEMSLMIIMLRRLVMIIPGGLIVSGTVRNIPANGVVIPKNMFSDKCVPGDKEILSKGVKSVHPWRCSIFRIMMELVPDTENRPLKLYVIRKHPNGEAEQEINIMGVNGPSKYTFELCIDPRELINFRFSRDTTVKLFAIEELYIP